MGKRLLAIEKNCKGWNPTLNYPYMSPWEILQPDTIFIPHDSYGYNKAWGVLLQIPNEMWSTPAAVIDKNPLDNSQATKVKSQFDS